MDLNRLKGNVSQSDLENSKLKQDKIKNPPTHEEGMDEGVEEYTLEQFLSQGSDTGFKANDGANIYEKDFVSGGSTANPLNNFMGTPQQQTKNPEDIFFEVVKSILTGLKTCTVALFKFMKETTSEQWGRILARAMIGEGLALLVLIVLTVFAVKKVLFFRTVNLIIFDIVLGAFTVLIFGFITDYVKGKGGSTQTSQEQQISGQGVSDFDLEDCIEDDVDIDGELGGTDINAEDEESFFRDMYASTDVSTSNVDINSSLESVDEASKNIDSNKLYDRYYLVSQYLKVLPKYTPEFAKETIINPGTDAFAFIDTSCTKAINALLSKELEDEQNTYLVEAMQTKLYIRAKMKRVKGLNKTDLIAKEIEPYFKEKKKDQVSVVVDIWGDFYDIKIFGKDNFFVSIADFLSTSDVSEFFTNADNVFPVVLGLNDEGEPITRDMKNLESLLIAGMPRSGKTWVGLNIMTQLCMFTSPEDLQFIILDPKDKTSDFLSFTVPHNIAFSGVPKEFLEILNILVYNEAKRRQDLIGKYGETNIWDLKLHHPDIQIPVIYVYIDEVVSVADGMSKEDKETFNKLLRILVTKLPNLGIRTILVPHVAKHQFLDKTIKSVIPFRASVMGNADHIKSTLDLTSFKFDYTLNKKGDMAMAIGSEDPMYIKSGVITSNSTTNKDIFKFIRRLWKSKDYKIETSPAMRRIYEYALDVEE